MAVRLDYDYQREPDVLIVTVEGYDNEERETWYGPEEVLLAVEVVSPESRKRDRVEKPVEYAEAGIPHFWRVERDGLGGVFHVFELEETTHTYVPTGIHHERLRLTVPFAIDIPIGRIP